MEHLLNTPGTACAAELFFYMYVCVIFALSLQLPGKTRYTAATAGSIWRVRAVRVLLRLEQIHHSKKQFPPRRQQTRSENVFQVSI
jgi:hypothetical protein